MRKFVKKKMKIKQKWKISLYDVRWSNFFNRPTIEKLKIKYRL